MIMFNSPARSLLASSLRAKPVARNPLNCLPSRTIITVKEVKYTAHATATGAGRDGHVKSNGLDLHLALPKQLGGSGKGENPEQLFAMGYASCFLGAIQAVAKGLGKEAMAKKAVVHTSVHIGEPHKKPGFGLAVDIKVDGVDEELLKAAHEFCPYSRALTRGAEVKVSVA